MISCSKVVLLVEWAKVTRHAQHVMKTRYSVRVLMQNQTYVGHRRFLKKPHKWRSSREFNGQTDNRDPLKEFGQDEILAQLDRLPTRRRTILNTLLMNDKSKDIAKARQDLQRLAFEWLVLGQTRRIRKYLKPQAAYYFTPENRKKFCQFIKGVKLPDGFGSCFKHKIKVVDILCDLELIYPPALFDIMIHLVIHLPLEALEGGPICPRWMFSFERYMKKLKGYVRNKAKPEGSIAGRVYVAEKH
ncbi:hypothetical protein Tco_0686660 [Tanacetum coccineum]